MSVLIVTDSVFKSGRNKFGIDISKTMQIQYKRGRHKIIH